MTATAVKILVIDGIQEIESSLTAGPVGSTVVVPWPLEWIILLVRSRAVRSAAWNGFGSFVACLANMAFMVNVDAENKTFYQDN